MMKTNVTEERFEIIARTMYGLEQVLADEIANIGAEEITLLNRAVSFYGSKETLYRANYELRTALRVYKPIYKFNARNEKDLYSHSFKYPWENILNPRTTFAIDSTVYSEHFNHENYVALKVKDALVDKLRTKYGSRPDVEIDMPDIRLHVHVSDDNVTISLDSSGSSLHKRGYRITQADAPMNEVLAAGMILLTGWKGDTDFIDPMCGSATILMEAATIAYNIAPGKKREHYSFFNWADWDPHLFDKICLEAEQRERESTIKIKGFDSSAKAISVSKDNIKNAGLGWKILLKQKEFESLNSEDIGNSGIVIINPPYGERIPIEEINDFYKSIGDTLKQNFDGFSVWIISSNKEAIKSIRLRTSKRLTLFNSQLECKYHNYQLYRGSKKSKYLNANKEITENEQ